MNKRDYEALIKRSKNRLLYAIYRESQKTLKNMVKYPYGEQENNLDEILYVLLLLIYNYAAWEVLDVTKLIELVRLNPILDPIVLKRVKRALKYDKGLLKSIYKDKIDQLSNFEVHQIFADMPDELKYYLSKVTSKVIFDAQKVIAAKQIDTENIESELKKFFHNRAKVVAETESVRYFNLGLLRASYFGDIVAFRYRAIMDEKTCPMCAARNGRIILANDFAGVLENTPPLHPNCYTEDHLLWTKSGWKHWSDVNEGELVWSLNPETLQEELTEVDCKVGYWYEGRVYRFYNELIDIKVTEDHNVWVLRNDRLISIKPEQVKRTDKMLSVIKGDIVETTDFEIEISDYEGYVYDVELKKNHVLLVMRNGKMTWSGNCRCYLEPLNRLPASFKLINEVETPALKRDIDKMLIGSVLR